MLARSTLRSAAQLARPRRPYSSAGTGLDYWARQAAAKAHAEATTDLWRRISFYICIPAILVGSVYVYNLEVEHKEHLDHLIEENGGVLPHAEHDYLHRRVKPFPWGNNVLFFHSTYNKNMEVDE